MHDCVDNQLPNGHEGVLPSLDATRSTSYAQQVSSVPDLVLQGSEAVNEGHRLIDLQRGHKQMCMYKQISA